PVRHKQLFVSAHADGAAVDEHQERVPEIVLLNRFAPEKVLAEKRLTLPIVGEDDALILAIVLGRIFAIVLALLAKKIDPDGETLAIDVCAERVVPLDVLPLRVFAVLFERVDEAGHRRVVAAARATGVVAAFVKVDR